MAIISMLDNKPGDLIKILDDINLAPEWRRLADKCSDYYDCNQLSADDLAIREAKGLPPIITNLIKPVVDTILGMELKNRQDWHVDVESGNDKEDQQLAEALSAKMHEAEKESAADVACSAAYAAMVKAGIGWAEVSRCSDPFKIPYRVEYVHRNEIDFDWRARKDDLSDARFLVRRKWYDNDVLQAMFPRCADKIKNITGEMSPWDSKLGSYGDTGLVQSNDIERGGSLDENEWVDNGRSRTCLFEVWYHIYHPGHVFKVKNRVIEFDKANQQHVQLYQAGVIEIKSAVITKTRQAFWVGPYRLIDRPTPYSHNKFPYVPFIAFREDLTGIPYGVIRPMLSPQDEFNARRAKMYELLSLRRVVTDDDAVVDHDAAAAEVANPDAYIILNSKRSATSQFNVQENGTLAKDQFQVMEDAGGNINKAAGITQTMMSPSATSGLAKQIDVEQGVTTLGALNSHYASARIAVGELLLDLLKEDIGDQMMRVAVGQSGRRKNIIINKPIMDAETGMQRLENDVKRSMTKMTLDAVSATATYRQQVATQLIEMTKSLPPQIQALVIDFVIESSDMPHRHEIVERIRKALHIPGVDNENDEDGNSGENAGPSPEEQQLQQQLEQTTQEAQAAIQQLQGALADAELKLKQEQSKSFDIKREIEGVKLQEAQAKVASNNNINGDKDSDSEQILDAKLNLIAEQVGKLTKIVSEQVPLQ